MFSRIQQYLEKNKFFIPTIISAVIVSIIYLANIENLLKVEAITYVVLIGILSSHYIKKNIGERIFYKQKPDSVKIINCYVLVFISLFLLILNGYIFSVRPKGYIRFSIVLNSFLLPFLLDILFSLTKNLWWKVIIAALFIVNFCILVVLMISVMVASIMFPSKLPEFFFAFLFLPSLLALIFVARRRLKKQ